MGLKIGMRAWTSHRDPVSYLSSTLLVVADHFNLFVLEFQLGRNSFDKTNIFTKEKEVWPHPHRAGPLSELLVLEEW